MQKSIPLLFAFSFYTLQGEAQCNAAFTSTINNAAVMFTPVSNVTTSSPVWYFGDGRTSTESAPTHYYDYPGTYTVRHIVRDSLRGCVDSVSQNINVNFTISCQAAFTFTRDSFLYNLYSFYANPVYTGSGIQSYYWIIDGNPVDSFSWFNYSFSPGQHLVCLTIFTNGGCTSSVCQAINVIEPQNCNWHPSFTTSASPQHPRDISFSPNPLSGTMKYRWDFGDGYFSSQKNPVHTFNNAGIYNVGLTVVDTVTWCSDSTRQSLTVLGTACDTALCSFTYTPVPGHQGAIAFHALCNESDSSQIWEIWRFNDFTFHYTMHSINPTYTFTDTGYYFVCMTANTGNNCQVSVCESIHVYEVASGNRYIISYPNPATDKVDFRLDLNEADRIKIRVYNINGNQAYSTEKTGVRGNNNISIPVQSLQKGQYFIDIEYGNKRKRSIFLKL